MDKRTKEILLGQAVNIMASKYEDMTMINHNTELFKTKVKNFHKVLIELYEESFPDVKP